LQRLPALSLALPLRALDGPLSGALTAEYARLAPLYALTGDEGQGAAEGSTLEAGRELSWACQANRLFGAGNAGCLGADHLPVPVDRGGEGDRRWQPGEREARDRFMVVPRLQLSGAAFDVVALSASAWWRQLAWVGEASGRTWSRGALVLDFSAETEASRRFGAWRHTLSPLVQLRAVPAVASGSSDPATPGPVPYDEVDAAVPPGAAGLVQGQVALRQRLSRVGSGDALRLDLAQGFWLPGGGQALSAGELSGRLAATVWLVSASAAARVDPVQGRLTRLQAAAGLDDGRGHGGGVAYENLLDSGTDRTRAPLDLLFGTPVPAWATSRASLLAANAFWSFGAVSVRYDLLFLQAGWAGGRLGLAQHALTVGLSPSCDCWRLDLSAVQRTDANGWLRVPDFGATLTVSRFGSLGTR
jgi:LPS-assembly protein